MNLKPAYVGQSVFLRPLAWAGIFCAILLILLASVPWQFQWPALLVPFIEELKRSGLLGSSIASLLLVTSGLSLSYAVVWTRQRGLSGEFPLISKVAGWPQAALLLIVTALTASVLYHFWPQKTALSAAADYRCSSVIGSLSIVLAFPLLVYERLFEAIPRSRLREAPDLEALLLVAVLVFFGQGLIEIAAGFGFSSCYWALAVIDCFLAAITIELALRTAAIWFMPPVDAENARAAITSLIAKSLRPGRISAAILRCTIKDHFGMDFSRSWALAYVRDAFAPVLVSLILFAWFFSGIVSVGLESRGSYEKLGAPAEILKPGLHLVLPWPLGQVRRVEYGAVHSLAITASGTGQHTPPATTDMSRAEEPPPAAANRLWDQEQGSDVSYIIASNDADRESFEIASVTVRIVYRIGMDDDSAARAIYRATDPNALVKTASGRMLANFFATETLSDLMVEDRQSLALGLKTRLQNDLDRLESGVEILGVVIESLRPPSGAAAAYHDVQAGAIIAATNIAAERGRAQTTLGLARQEAAETTRQSQATAAELESDATVELAHFRADAVSYKAAGRAFLLERYFADLQAALGQSSLEIIDHRLGSPNAPVLDLRPEPGLTEALTASERQTP